MQARVLFAGASVTVLLGLLACGTSEPELEVSLEVVGSGCVVSTPAGIDCCGPKECGTARFVGDVTLRATPAEGSTFVHYLVGREETTSTALTLTLEGGAAAVVATFGGAGGPAQPEGDAGRRDASEPEPDAGPRDSGGGDASEPEPEPDAAVPNYAAQCGSESCASSGEYCCVDRDQAGSGLNAAECDSTCDDAQIQAECSRADECGDGEECCADVVNYELAGLRCTPAGSCADHRSVCEKDEDCPEGARCAKSEESPAMSFCLIPV